MALIAIVGLAAWSVKVARPRLERARHHALWASEYRSAVLRANNSLADLDSRTPDVWNIRHSENMKKVYARSARINVELSERHARMQEKWQAAAYQPWRGVERDSD